MRYLYHKLIPYEWRFWLYKLRHSEEFSALLNEVFPSPKGDFSLRAFDHYKCLFIHVTKSAGTSVAKSLFGEMPYHYTAIQYRVIYGRSAFNRYFKFAFVRNPWDRLYSAYSFLKAGGWNGQDCQWYHKNLSHLPDFNSFVLKWLEPERLHSHLHFMPQSAFICDQGGYPLLNFLGYFDSLVNDFSYIAKVLENNSRLEHINASKRIIDYRDAYTSRAIDKVGYLYHRDIENFGYEFDGLKTRKYIRNRRFEVMKS